jgi:hypothetical protein
MYNETAEFTGSAISKYDCVVQEPKELGRSSGSPVLSGKRPTGLKGDFCATSPSFFQSFIRPLLAWKYLEEKASVDGDWH